ncbi:hypothetical protein BKA64DRAFT_658774 [Cadophora sp. MPI-SDFR-AT-0126]|nr:hypothetical protein BKA64DRAFT_658774 [Leotiomycetes sp. MPI-SDFR-AT-0126]
MATQKYYLVIFTCVVVFLLVPFRSLGSKRATTIIGLPGISGVGVSLTASYGVVSLRKDDGTFEDVGRIESIEDYAEMIERLSAPGAQRASPPYDTMEELWEDWPRQLLRSARKRIGLAASGDVAVLSRVLQQVLDLQPADPRISLRANPVVISYPALYGLSQEDIADAAEYLGLSILSGNHHYQPCSIVAAYAGHGLGLCDDYRDMETCRQEGLDLPAREVLLVEHTEHALFLHAKVMREAYELASRDIAIFTDFSLGHVEVPRRAEKIGQAVRQFLQEKYKNVGLPDKLTAIMTGSKICKEVSQAIEKAAKDLGCDVEILNGEPEYIAARGAAELAWRSLERAVLAGEL